MRKKNAKKQILLAVIMALPLSVGCLAAYGEERGTPPTRDAGYARVHSGAGGAALNTGLNDIDQAILPCVTDTKTCMFGISAMVIISNGGASNPWMICATVDGRDASPLCADQQDAPTDHPISGTSLQSLKVTPGKHRVRVRVYVSGPATLGGWNVIYQAYPN